MFQHLQCKDNNSMRKVPKTVIEKMNARVGNDIKVSEIVPYKNGMFEGGFNKIRKA